MSALESALAYQIRVSGLPEPEREVLFHPSRKWRFDLAWRAQRLAVEIEGGIYTNGRHVRASGFAKDAEKYNSAALLGWRVLRFTPEMVKSGKALNVIEEALKQ